MSNKNTGKKRYNISLPELLAFKTKQDDKSHRKSQRNCLPIINELLSRGVVGMWTVDSCEAVFARLVVWTGQAQT